MKIKLKAGLHKYLKRHEYKNALTEDLWKALGEAANQDVKTIMDSWTKQTGYPVLHGTKKIKITK